MEPLYIKEFEVSPVAVDRYGRLKLSQMLGYLQDIAGDHSAILGTNQNALMDKNLFWAIIRHRVQITRLPGTGEKLRLETWPMPTTRVAYPRSMVAYDEAGNELFRTISLWVLMDLDTRSMILPGKSGISVNGTLRGFELEAPAGLVPKPLNSSRPRIVSFTDLDRNGHMNNCRYLDWISDLLPSPFHAQHTLKEFTICYLSEAREGQQLDLHWDFLEDGALRVDAFRHGETKDERVLSAKLLFE